ncbi:hypothetical protein CRG98_028282 [Punica granatum]|uniref:Uncharacterized protein n=1 Tax=Punica granatum TaxID=22663 RepID=A0A2I0J528_PUNGR|nr:hypothetical protein CRG98_028282 [Punica granatum]
MVELGSSKRWDKRLRGSKNSNWARQPAKKRGENSNSFEDGGSGTMAEGVTGVRSEGGREEAAGNELWGELKVFSEVQECFGAEGSEEERSCGQE